MQKKFKSPYRYFAEHGREYVISPLIPRHCKTMISSGDYHLMISQTGSGYNWHGNAAQNRIPRSFQDLVKDYRVKYFYTRDLRHNTFWSSAPKSVTHSYQRYKVMHNVGNSRFTQSVEQIESILTVFADATTEKPHSVYGELSPERKLPAQIDIS